MEGQNDNIVNKVFAAHLGLKHPAPSSALPQYPIWFPEPLRHYSWAQSQSNLWALQGVALTHKKEKKIWKMSLVAVEYFYWKEGNWSVIEHLLLKKWGSGFDFHFPSTNMLKFKGRLIGFIIIMGLLT